MRGTFRPTLIVPLVQAEQRLESLEYKYMELLFEGFRAYRRGVVRRDMRLLFTYEILYNRKGHQSGERLCEETHEQCAAFQNHVEKEPISFQRDEMWVDGRISL